ncbi:DUF1302 domain-containing protein [Ectopseudomonas mendocina]|uniref:DUF1302 domain-containing protein n=2 Tax=Ectopseudomonas mendocina TaxID=300 RepID=A0ABD7RSH9_ECTME|nr:DUF1302 domain-containing protein [Pseudomonas mendocina]ALN18016.1 adhesin [Pseudomonas mendocina S5.2]KES01158.1 hypothetical protein HN51_15250 [Pseudomonas mendocina]TRO12540.1 DUF1302 domain-containing protein [Pseudomonas mendocina]TRO14727.1 DUF1302 domain-containing protein [Pseudomonas mendocina]
MTTKTTSYWRLAKLPLAVSLASTLAAPAFGVTFNIGEIEGQFDSQLSIGASWSTEKADKDLIGYNNGGRGLSMTSDDSRMNFKRGETFSKIFKGVHDLELKYGDTGVFVRGKYWYDFELKDESRPFKDISDSNRKQGAQSSGAEILDAFIYHNYAIGNQPGSVRLGKQVVNWGESTFIGGGVNSVNPIDVAAFRRPGAEIKEGLIPVNMFYVAQSLTDNLSMEAFYQLEWDQTVVDNCGTFFSQPDVVADGCDKNLALLAGSTFLSANPAAIPTLNALGVEVNEEGVIVQRGADRDAKDSGQWGVAFRYLFEPLDTEFGFYFMNYHSRAPIFSATAGSQALYDLANTGAFGALTPLVIAGNSKYFIEYPEDIRLYGLSFSTTLPTGTAWSGEISYRPNAPVQLNTTDILYAGLTPLSPAISPAYPNASILQGTPGQDLHGYNRKEITQLQTTFTHFFDQVMGASRLTLVGEIGWTHVGGLEGKSKARYGRDPIFGPGELPVTLPGLANINTCAALNNDTLGRSPFADQSFKNVSRYCDNDGFTTSDSWGYRARAIWEYPNAIAGVNLRPSVAWSHDVKGYSPGPGANFEEGRKAVSLGLNAEYQNTYTADLSYTTFFGGGDFNTQRDRDFVALSFGMNF